MAGPWVIIGGVDMKNGKKSQVKSREAKNRTRYDQWAKKREEDITTIDREKPLTYNLGELYRVNRERGFITHRNPRIDSMERR